MLTPKPYIVQKISLSRTMVIGPKVRQFFTDPGHVAGAEILAEALNIAYGEGFSLARELFCEDSNNPACSE